jgi:osmotically-inducible protein OsmY
MGRNFRQMNLIVRMIMGSAVLLTVGGIHANRAAALDAQVTTDAHVSDARRETQILARFNTDAQLRAYDLTVIVDGERAALGGTVANDAARNLAGSIVADIGGVRHVDNRVRVDANVSSAKQKRQTPHLDAVLNDAAIGAAVKSRLQWNTHTEGLDIRVDSSEGNVTLAGTAISYAERDVAGIVAGNTDGVVHVANELVLSSKMRAPMAWDDGKAPTDAWITSRVRGSLLLTRGVSRSAIVVTTMNGVVSLRGMVAGTAERELAMQVAQDVRGVKQVDAAGLEVG